MHADSRTNNYYKYHTSPRTSSSQLQSAADDEVLIMLATQLNDLSRSWLINKYRWEAGEQHWGIYNPHSWVQNTHGELVRIVMRAELIWPGGRFIQSWIRQRCLRCLSGEARVNICRCTGFGQCISDEPTGVTSFCMTGLSHKDTDWRVHVQLD